MNIILFFFVTVLTHINVLILKVFINKQFFAVKGFCKV